MDTIWIPKSPQNRIKNVIDFGIDFYTILAPKISSKMHPKGRKKSGGRSLCALQEASKIKLRFLVVFRCLWKLFGLPPAAFFVDFGRLLASLWPSLRPFWRPLAALFMPKVPQYQRKQKKRKDAATLRESTENGREPAEILPRTRRGPAVRTPHRNISHKATARKELHPPTNDQREGLE